MKRLQKWVAHPFISVNENRQRTVQIQIIILIILDQARFCNSHAVPGPVHGAKLNCKRVRVLSI